MGTTTIIAGLASGLIPLPYAKVLDIYGRPQGLAFMVVIQTVGLVMMAARQNVEAYCAAQVFYAVGSQSLSFTATMFIADTCSLRARALVLGLMATPTIATVWAAGSAAQRVINGIGLAWGFGIWCIVLPVVWAPLVLLLLQNQRLAKKQGLVAPPKTIRSPVEKIVDVLIEFDIAGLLILATGFTLFLLSFNLYIYQEQGWNSAMIICFIIFGGLLIFSFPIYERYLAPRTFVPWSILMNQTILLTYFVSILYYMSEAAWGTYFYSLLIVVFNGPSQTQPTSVTHTSSARRCGLSFSAWL